jgi:hypothetical protein
VTTTTANTKEHSPAAATRLGLRNRHLIVATSILVLAPNLLFAARLNWPAALALVVGSLLAAVMLARPWPTVSGGGVLEQPIDLRALAISVGAALSLILLGGEGHLVYANKDWLWRDAVLADLSRTLKLPTYAIPNAGHYILRAPLGMYLGPALVGRLLGLSAAHAAMAVQNAVLLGLLLYGFQGLFPARRWLASAVMLGSSGLGIVGVYLWQLFRHVPISPTSLPSHLEGWGPWQYSSQITQIFWVPNHFLPGWWCALLALLVARGEVTLAWFGLSLATTAIWSPLPAVGALPFLLLQFGRTPLAYLKDGGLWLYGLAGVLFIPVAAYEVASSGSIPRGGQWDQAGFFVLYLPALLIQLMPALLVIFVLERYPPEWRGTIYVGALILAALPFVSFGPSNDLAMRASIPSLAVLAFSFAAWLASGPAEQPRLWWVAGALALVAGVTPAFEVARDVVFQRYEISDCDFASAQADLSASAVSPNYMAERASFSGWLIGPSQPATPITPRRRNCWPDYPFNPRLFVGVHTTAELLQSRSRAGR